MLALSIIDIGAIAAIAIIVIIFAAIGLMKGLVRMTFGLVALAAGILAGFWGFQKGASIAGIVVSDPDPWMSGAVGVILGLAVFFVARALFGVLLSPVNVKDGKKRNLGLPGGILGFFMGASFVWFGLSGIRYLGTLSELAWIKSATADGKVEQLAQPLLAKAKRAIDGSIPGQMHQKYDFLNDRARANLAKLTVMIDNRLATAKASTTKEVREAIRQQQIYKMLYEQSADLQAYIDNGQYAHLLQSSPIKAACQDSDAADTLAALDLEVALGLIEIKKEDEKKGKEKK